MGKRSIKRASFSVLMENNESRYDPSPSRKYIVIT
jgi:hypothetical protein